MQLARPNYGIELLNFGYSLIMNLRHPSPVLGTRLPHCLPLHLPVSASFHDLRELVDFYSS